MSKFQGVADTLFIPLTARIYASKRFPEYFYDETALSLEKEIPGDGIEKGSNEYTMLASVARYYNMDAMINEFARKNGKCNVVNLGAGFETASRRIKNPDITFYLVDLPHVAKARERVLGAAENEILIGADIFNSGWAEKIQGNLPILFVVSGVFQYFHEEDILKLISGLKEKFPGSEMIFDATNKAGIRYADRYVKKTGNTSAKMYFSVEDPKEFAQKSGTVLLGYRHFYTDARKILKGKVNFYSRIAMRIVDGRNMAFILHIRL